MASMTIRTVTPDDAAAAAAIVGALEPANFATADSLRLDYGRRTSEGTVRLLAEVDGDVVGLARTNTNAAGVARIWVGVLEPHRGAGIGSALYERSLARLGAVRRLHGEVETAAGRSFVTRRGFELVDVQQLQALDLRQAELPPSRVPTASLREVGAECIGDLYVRSMLDVPVDASGHAFTLADFRRQVVESPIVDHDASVVVLEDGEPIAFTVVIASRETGRAGAQMTGVRSDRRGRGLAQAVKLESMRRARERGLRVMLTANHVGNEAMLAVNRKLGFEPSILIEHYEKAL